MRFELFCLCLKLLVVAWQVQPFVVTDREVEQFVVTDHGKADTVTPVAESRPVVRMYWAAWCGPCGSAKTNWLAYVKEHPAPFDVEFIDLSHGGQPAWADRLPKNVEFVIPAWAWEVKGQTRYVFGYPGAEKLIESWRLTQPKKTSQPRGPPKG